MKAIEIAFTSYPVTDLKRARRFYEGVLNLKPSHIFGDENTGWIEYDIGAGTLAIGNGSPDWKPSAGGGCVGIEVESFEEAIGTLKANEIPLPKSFDTPVCHMAIISDPDGNSIIIHKRKTSTCAH